ncbi:hypothetical protein [Frondihabitans sucicola]|uniref:hypothetical protein n=1 Tax=Frondihabitans sucicola TaxID=1268041 RepID=UPI002572F8BE|nr:hypothetical protein [Frondihabitans sucicola]
MITNVASSVTSDSDSTAATTAPNSWTISGLVYSLTDAKTVQTQQQANTATATGTTPTGSSSTDTAAGK